MKILKNDGTSQPFMPNKILNRIKTQSRDLKVNPDYIFQKVIPSISDGMNTTTIDEIIAFKSADLMIEHPDYSILGARILLTRQGKRIGVELQDVDLKYDFFGAVTFLKNYSLRDDNGNPIELPSMMYDRVANFLGKDDEEREEFSRELKSKRISVATPILTNCGTDRKSYISCNLTSLIDDSKEGIQETINNIASASKEGAGIGLLIDPIRSKESLVSSFKGKASGLVRLADMVQSTLRFYKQGSRSGSCALYLSVWHKDIMDFLELRLPVGEEKLRARDLFTAVVINDKFMRCLKTNEDWYIFCPNDIVKSGLKPLYELWGDEFEEEYQKAVDLGIGEKINPKRIWDAIIRSQAESGTPYVWFKDNANKTNMQSNIGVITQSNLCVAPETKILTKEHGYVPIHELEDMLVTVWNGKQWSETVVVKTGTNQKLIKVVFEKNINDGNGKFKKEIDEIYATPYHKWYVYNSVIKRDMEVRTMNLVEGDITCYYVLPDVKGFNYSRIISADEVERTSDTYCVKETLQNKVVFNGVLTGNCIEITEVSRPNYTAQCTLGLIPLTYHNSLESIHNSTRILTKMLNRVIDKNKWSDEPSRLAGLDQRALAIGIGGLADFIAMKKLSFTSDEAKEWNEKIEETIYKASLLESNRLSVESGITYPSWEGSPYSEGKTRIEGWNPMGEGVPIPMLNSLLVSNMPSASCSTKEMRVITSKGVKSFEDILLENDVDVFELEKTNNKQWIEINNIEVKTLNGFVETDSIYYNGIVETLQIEMEDGTIFTCSENHRFLVDRNGIYEYVKVEDLLEGDDIVNIFN